MSRIGNNALTSIAIAGAWGYIGRKFFEVALASGLDISVYDPGPAPADIDLNRVRRFDDEDAFYRLDADLFHLAVQPEHRQLDRLLARNEPLWILDEKPMAPPEDPGRCDAIVAAVDRSQCVVLYDFPELFDPLTARILDHLASFREVKIHEIHLERSKDREDPAIPRNYKRMVPIQYQESVHCLAFVLWLLGHLHGSPEAALAAGLRLEARSEPYAPPNPDLYPRPVDGRCDYTLQVGDVHITGRTNFRRGAPWSKRRVIRGIGDGRPFEIDASYLEGRKWLRIDGEPQACDPSADSYAQVLATFARWAAEADREALMHGLYPNPRFTRLAYRLSSALWRSSRDQAEARFATAADLGSYTARYADGRPREAGLLADHPKRVRGDLGGQSGARS